MAVATAPASILHVTRELGATGKLTSTLLAVVAVDNGLAIILFGLIFTIAKNLVAAAGGSLFIMVGRSFGDTLLALGMGLAAGLLLDVIIVRLKHRAEMLTVGLAVLLLCGETARLLNLSPLLAGIAVGFIVVNHGRRDVRIFRAINDFEPPIYVLFFTLAGAHVDLGALGVAGGLALLYFLLRAAGKIGGAYLGGRLAGAPDMLGRLLGVSLLPQAGVAIGLVFLVQGEPGMKSFSEIITPWCWARWCWPSWWGRCAPGWPSPGPARPASKLTSPARPPRARRPSPPQRGGRPADISLGLGPSPRRPGPREWWSSAWTIPTPRWGWPASPPSSATTSARRRWACASAPRTATRTWPTRSSISRGWWTWPRPRWRASAIPWPPR